jgi:pterin-4a-carbinolamine dehydratase
MNKILMKKKMKILDSPSYVINTDNLSPVDLILHGFMDPVDVSEPLESIEEIISRCGKEKLSEIYKIGEFDDVIDFLNQIGKKKIKNLEGGEPDIEAAVEHVVLDWMTGQIPYYTTVPKTKQTNTNNDNSWTKKINIDNIYKQENTNTENLKDDVYNFIVIEGKPSTIEIDITKEFTIESFEDLEESSIDEDGQPPSKKRKTDQKKNQSQPLRNKKTNKQSTTNVGEEYNFDEYFGDDEDDEEAPIEETPVKETPVKETPVKETKVKETKIPETKIPETKVPETKVSQAKVPQAKVPQAKAPQTKAPQTKVPQIKTTKKVKNN